MSGMSLEEMVAHCGGVIEGDKIVFTFTDRVAVEEELLKLAVGNGIEKITILWSRGELAHEYNTGSIHRRLSNLTPADLDEERLRDDMEKVINAPNL